MPAGGPSGPYGPAVNPSMSALGSLTAVGPNPEVTSDIHMAGDPGHTSTSIHLTRNDPHLSAAMNVMYNEYNQANTVNVLNLFTPADTVGRDQAVREVMQEADRRHEVAMEAQRRLAVDRLASAEARADQTFHTRITMQEAQLAQFRFRFEAADAALRSELAQAQEALTQSKAKVQHLESSAAELRSTLSQEFLQNREATLQFLKTEFEESQAKLKQDFSLQENQMQEQNDFLHAELTAAEAELQEVRNAKDATSLPKGNAEAQTGGVPVAPKSPKFSMEAPPGPMFPDPNVIPESFRGIFSTPVRTGLTYGAGSGPASHHGSGLVTPASSITGHIGFGTQAPRTGSPPPKTKPVEQSVPDLDRLTALELIRSGILKGKSDDDKPKTKEAESIKLPDFPNPETYRSWKAATREAIRAASDQPDDAFLWLLEAYDKDITHDKLRDPGKFLTLDTKLLAALTKVAKGELARQILNFKESEAANKRAVRGRQVLYMFNQHFKTNEEVGSLYSVEDLLKVSLIQDDLGTFIHNWDSVIAGMSHMPDETTLRDVLLRQIRKSQRLKFDLEKYERAKEGTPEHSYEFLIQAIRDLLTRERMRKNRDRIAKSHGDKYGAAAGSENRTPRTPSRARHPRAGSRSPSRSPSRGSSRSPSRSQSPRSRSQSPNRQLCKDFQRGKCNRGDACKFLHQHKARTPSGPKGQGKKKINATCVFWRKGKCNQGDKCRFLHHEKAQSPGRTPTPNKPPETAAPAREERPRSPSPARRRPKSRGRSPTKDKPAACCLSVPEATLTGVAAAATQDASDHWEIDFKRKRAIRHHNRYRSEPFVPTGDCPISIKKFKDCARVEKILPVSPYTTSVNWDWRNSAFDDSDKTPWIGRTIFYIKDDPLRRVSFDSKPKIIRIESVGAGRRHTTKPRSFTVCYSEASFCPRPDQRDRKYAIENARILEGVVKASLSGMECKCKFCCDFDASMTCEYCEATMKTACPSTSGLEFLADTGSEEDLISRGDHATYYSSIPVENASRQVNLITANGPVQGNKSVTLPIPELGKDLEFYLLESTPPVCSVGRRCMEEGFDFHWPAGQVPYFITPEGRKLRCRMKGRVPVIGDLDAWASPASEQSGTKEAGHQVLSSEQAPAGFQQ